VLIDLERGNLLQTTFKLPTPLAVPDVLYEQELSQTNGALLVTLGLRVMTLDDRGVRLAQSYLIRARGLSVSDAFALALAKSGPHVLVCGDRVLRAFADAESVECRGLFWILDRILEAQLATRSHLRAALKQIAGHPRCRLPQDLIEAQLAKYSRT